jgi:hypothetical protein
MNEELKKSSAKDDGLAREARKLEMSILDDKKTLVRLV